MFTFFFISVIVTSVLSIQIFYTMSKYTDDVSAEYTIKMRQTIKIPVAYKYWLLLISSIVNLSFVFAYILSGGFQ